MGRNPALLPPETSSASMVRVWPDVAVPENCPGVPNDVLDPRLTWADIAAYDEQAHRVAGMFRDNFSTFESSVPEAVRQSGPFAVHAD